MSSEAIRSCLLICSLTCLASPAMAQAERPGKGSGVPPACLVPDYRTPPLVIAGGIYPRCDGGSDPLALAALRDGRAECVCYEGNVSSWVNACRLAGKSMLTRIDNAVYCPGF